MARARSTTCRKWRQSEWERERGDAEADVHQHAERDAAFVAREVRHRRASASLRLTFGGGACGRDGLLAALILTAMNIFKRRIFADEIFIVCVHSLITLTSEFNALRSFDREPSSCLYGVKNKSSPWSDSFQIANAHGYAAVGVPPKNHLDSSYARRTAGFPSTARHLSPKLQARKDGSRNRCELRLVQAINGQNFLVPFSARSPHARTSTSLLSAPAAAQNIVRHRRSFWLLGADSLAGFLEELSQPRCRRIRKLSYQNRRSQKNSFVRARKSEHDFKQRGLFPCAGNLHNLRNVRAGQSNM